MVEERPFGGARHLYDVIQAATLKAVSVELGKGHLQNLASGGFRGFGCFSWGHARLPWSIYRPVGIYVKGQIWRSGCQLSAENPCLRRYHRGHREKKQRAQRKAFSRAGKRRL